MFFRFQGSVCLLLAAFAAGTACYSPQAFGEGPPSQVARQSEWEARIDAALDAKGEWEFRDEPLNQVCAALQEKLNIDVALDVKSLEDYGIDTSTPVTRSVRGISNRSFLRLILSDLELTYTVRYGALWITTPEAAEARLITKVYPVGDLLVRDTTVAENFADFDSLIKAISNAISSDTWDEVGGPGSIEGIYDALVISQVHEVHEEVERLVTAYRGIIAAEGEPNRPQPTAVMLGRDTGASLQAALDEPFTGEFKDTELSEVLKVISTATNIPIVIDTRALEDFGIDSSTPISAKFGETPLRFALFRILNQLELTFTIRDELLVITTPEVCESQIEIRLYPVRDLVQMANALPIVRPGADCDFDSLIQVITSTIAPDSWDSVGGPGVIQSLLPAPTLLVAQTRDNHEEIAELLVKLRAAKKQEAARTKTGKAVDPEALIVRSYPIYAAYNAPDEVVKLIMRATEGTWDDEAGTFVQGLGMAIVVKHNASGHRQVQKLLSQLGVWSPRHNAAQGSGGGGGLGGSGAGTQPTPGGVGGGFGGGQGGGFF